MTATIKRICKNDYFQTGVTVALFLVLIVGFYVAETSGFIAVVPSGSMCIPYGGACDGWTHPFDRTLHVGDILLIQPVDPATLNADYPNSDVIVFHNPSRTDELIVHRITAETQLNDIRYFYTKGDGNPPVSWPDPVQPYMYDHWYSSNTSIPQGSVSQDLVVGKVSMRIPWIGHIALFTQSVFAGNYKYLAMPIIALLIVLLITYEFILPLIKKQRSPPQNLSETALHR
ncbi:MAG: S26 family signal peptidase [Candidatus Bathyarchaeota archaeon]|nr:S26 family signal peptidase [Candidatus Bathyarchaeota archaeon]